MFENFKREKITNGDIEINLVVGGSGPPLLLLHGYPQTHLIWRMIAPRLAKSFTVIATDLRGYGGSSKPPGLSDHSNYSKRAMADDQVEVMRQLGFKTFLLCGHDRGGRVGHRLATDYPELVEKLVVLDIAPTKAMYEGTTMSICQGLLSLVLFDSGCSLSGNLNRSGARSFFASPYDQICRDGTLYA